jgi:catechol 2,3-dioxygenase-like lactoylglutathione lyase family enzyme
VSVPRPPGSAEQARAFYGGVPGFEEAPIPRSLRMNDLVWYRLGDTELHLFAESPHADPSGRHFCVEVDNLEATRLRLTAIRGCCARPTGRARVETNGNTIELTRIVADYRTELEDSHQETRD